MIDINIITIWGIIGITTILYIYACMIASKIHKLKKELAELEELKTRCLKKQ